MAARLNIPLALFAGLCLAGRRSAEPAELTLVKDGQPASVIVIPSEWLFWQKLAADELQHHLKKMSGATVPVVPEDKYRPQPDQVLILVAQGRRLSAMGIDTTRLGPETMVIKAAGTTLVLAGEDGTQEPYFRKPFLRDIPLYGMPYITRNGSLFAVYELLQEYLGCRWIFPGEVGEVIPKRSTVTVPADLDVTRSPKLAQRRFRSFLTTQERQIKQYKDVSRRFPDLMAAYERASDDEALWMLRMRMGCACYIIYGHAFTEWWKQYGEDKVVQPDVSAAEALVSEPAGEKKPAEEAEDPELEGPKTTAKDKKDGIRTVPGQPELFALQPDGSRGCQKGGSPEYVKMCVSNPKLWDLLIQRFRQQVEADPELPIKALSICENDGDTGFCTCEGCRAWDASTDGKPRMQGDNVVLSERYARFFNEMAKRVKEVVPDAWVVGYAYSWYQPAPRVVELAPNVLMGLTEFSRYPMAPASREHARRTFEGWARGGGRTILRPNAFYYFGGRSPFVVTHEMADDFRFMLDRGLWGTDFDGFPGFWATSGPTYYVLARMHWDTGADVEALLDEYYGAFGPMKPVAKEYFDFWEDRTKTVAHPDAQVFAQARAILEKAGPALEKALPEEVERFRNIDFGLQHCELMLSAQRPKAGEEDKDKLLAAAKALMDLRHEMVARNVTNVFSLTLSDLQGNRTYVRELRYPKKAKDGTEEGASPSEEPPTSPLDAPGKAADAELPE